MSATGHAIILLADSTHEHAAWVPKEKAFVQGAQPCGGGRGKGGSCKEPPVFEASYRYQPSRRSFRMTTSRTPMCATHGAAFAARHHLELPAVPA